VSAAAVGVYHCHSHERLAGTDGDLTGSRAASATTVSPHLVSKPVKFPKPLQATASIMSMENTSCHCQSLFFPHAQPGGEK
jgi:hypothetical protein